MLFAAYHITEHKYMGYVDAKNEEEAKRKAYWIYGCICFLSEVKR